MTPDAAAVTDYNTPPHTALCIGGTRGPCNCGGDARAVSILLTQGRSVEAAALANRTIRLSSRAEDLHLYGVAALANKDYGEALWAYREAVRFLARERRHLSIPSMWWFDIGMAYLGLGKTDEATKNFRRCLKDNPTHVAALLALAHEMRLQGNREEADVLVGRAMKAGGETSLQRSMLADHLLEQGDYEKGWAWYEERFAKPYYDGGYRPKGLDESKRWDGEPVQRLLVYQDQGMGDAIMMSRYLPWARSRCEELIIAVHPSLVTLIGQGDWYVYNRDDYPLPPPHDAHVAMMSLPFAHKTTLATIPPPIPFIDAARPRGVLLQVGFCWAGSGTVAAVARDKNLPVDALAPILTLPGVAPISLQLGDREHEYEILRLVMSGMSWFDTARQIADYLDLVITVDTGVAHLAASLGVETWICTPTYNDWRWPESYGDRTPWYESARLYRRKSTNDWPQVLDKLRHDLQVKVHGAD